MSVSTLRDGFQKGLVEFLWDEWGQMGVSANTDRRDTWAMDPEALLLLTFEVGRGEPRLFEEVLDWMVVNDRLLSVQRLRNLAEDDDDRALVEAVIGWLGQIRKRNRLEARQESVEISGTLRRFFRDSKLKVVEPDPAFLAQRFLKPQGEPARKSQPPNVRLPINLAFGLRSLQGVGVRAEVVRVLLTTDAPWMNAQALAATTAFTKRNIQDALASLATDDFVDSWTVGNERRYKAPRARWARFLRTDSLPGSRDWRQLFHAYRLVLRWLVASADEDLSEYILLSGARTLIEDVEDDLRFAGFPIAAQESTRDLESFERFIRDLTPM